MIVTTELGFVPAACACDGGVGGGGVSQQHLHRLDGL